jgi:hypothetical protein
MLSTPALTFFSRPNDALAPGFKARVSEVPCFSGCASAELFKTNWAAATVMAAAPKKWRRSWSTSSDMMFLPVISGVLQAMTSDQLGIQSDRCVKNL